MTETGRPPRHPQVRPVDLALPERAPTSVTVTHGDYDIPIERREYVTPWQRDALMALTKPGTMAGKVPDLIVTLETAGLVHVIRGNPYFTASLTDAGRTAVHRGWYWSS